MSSKSYENGKIYKILNHIDDKCYIGSTTQSLSKRMGKHRIDMKSSIKCNRLLYKHMLEHGTEQFYIELVENCPCHSVEELRKREGELIRLYGTLNKAVAGRTREETNKAYRDSHTDQINLYNETIKEKRLEQMKAYREKNKEQIKEYKKQFYEQNKEQILSKQKDYHEKKKNKSNETTD